MVAADDRGEGPDVVCIGSAALDLLLVVDELPGADGRVPADTGMVAGGGPAATAAVALARLGARVELIACVGEDLPGRIIREQLDDSHKYFIAEMGAYGPGSVARLCLLAPPDIGVITAIGHAHLRAQVVRADEDRVNARQPVDRLGVSDPLWTLGLQHD